MKIKTLIYFSILISLASCWPEDDAIEPIYFKKDSKFVDIPYSMYEYDSYYSLANNELPKFNLKSDWDIGFECSENGETIILNSADLLEVANLGAVDFASISSVPDNAEFLFDASSGNKDSLAFYNWVNTQTSPYSYSNNLYILARKEGLNYVGYRKLIFTELTASSYTMLIGNMDAEIPDTIVVEKDPLYNYSCYKVIDGINEVAIEPEKNEWDFKLCQYSSILYTEDGIATKYSVRGTLTNPNNTAVGKWHIAEDVAESDQEVSEAFANIDSTYIDSVLFEPELDVIGWDWKDVTIDEATNTSFYKTDPRKIYIIKINNNQFYKLHFISFYNNSGVKGYPSFEYAQLK